MVLSLALLSYVSAVQPDVARVRTLLDEVDRSVARADVNDSEELQAACIVALGGTLQDALPDLFSGSVPRENVQELKDQLRKYVRARVKALPDGGTSTPARREAVEALARELTSRDTAVQLISAWLGLPAGAGGLPAPAAPGALFAGARKALAAAREKVVAQPEPKQGAAVSQLRSDAGPALDIVVELTESQLLADVGGPGAGNGQVDGGEWIHLRLVLKNRSPRPWFSTSALFDAKGGCLAMPTASPVVVAELLPGATGALDTWVYASQRCPDDARRFSLKLRDTHQGGPEGTAEVLTLGAHEVAWPSLANPRLDADAWGFSDGKELPRISPDERFEFSTGVALPGVRAQGVTTRFTLPADLAGLFRTPPRLAEAPLLEDKPGKFIPSDDADLVTVERRAFEQVVNGATGSKAWVAGEQGGTLWLAVDTELAVGDRVPAAPAAKAVQAPPAASLQPPSAEAVAKLARQSVSLVARPKSPSLPNGVVAAEGYEATFDATAFMEKYRDLVSPPPAPSPAAAEMEAPASPGEAGTKYTFRTFYALPLAPVSARPPPPAPLPPPPPPPPPPERPAPPPAPVTPPPPVARDVSLRVDVLAAVHLHSTGQLPDRPFAFDGQSSLLLPSLGARVLYGTSLAALGGLRAGVLNFTAMDGLSTNAFEAAAQMGAGYHVEMAPNFRLTPWVAAELGVRTLGNVGSHTYFLLGAGATARADVTPSLSLLLEAAWFPVGYSAGFDAFLGNTGPRLGIGVGFF